MCLYCSGSMTWPQTQTDFHYITGCTQEGRNRLELEPGWRGAGRRNVGQSRTMTSYHRAFNLYLCNSPSTTRAGKAREEALRTDRSPPSQLSGGREERQAKSSDLISEEGKEKGGERRIRVLPLLYFVLSPLLTVTQDCVLWMPQRWSCYAHKAQPGLILLPFCSLTIQAHFTGASIQISVVQGKQIKQKLCNMLSDCVRPWQMKVSCCLASRHFNIPKFTFRHLSFTFLNCHLLSSHRWWGDFEEVPQSCY